MKNNQSKSEAGEPEAESSPTYADLQTRGAVADIWAQLEEAASTGDTQAREFLKMFGPFAAERLGQRPKS